MLLNYHISHFVLVSLCVGDLVRLGLSSIRVAACNKSCISIHTSSLLINSAHDMTPYVIIWNTGCLTTLRSLRLLFNTIMSDEIVHIT